ncbi:hypothetical protein EDD76_109171 [Kineothrix alysoides]|uniref:Uncharacterized protein n=1 Tax=Kineothrix alysoides TaxID=1469948 RepID=A0A4R1QTV4_9FIRM|nr:hypothetical protein [Kineothrix alysoides]TCL57308.1 hypothetical protein EDD76_109171 [Kineothrix alysoides]
MKELLAKKTIGYYIVILAGILGLVSVIRFLLWAPNHGGMDGIIVVGLVLGLGIDILLIFKDNNYFVILATICYSVAVMQLLTNSVGSFVDVLQGINMFGDASQVGSIVSISVVILVCVLLSVLAGFFKRIKE